MAKKKTKRVKPRNPFADAVRMDAQFRVKIAKSNEERAVQRDEWDRKGKYNRKVVIYPDGE